MAKGYSFEAVCSILNVNRKTAYDWVKKYPEFEEAKEKLVDS